MEQNEEIEMQLWEYLDGACTDADKQRISLLISQDVLWQEKFDELSALHKGIISNMELETPSLRFSKNVMEAVSHVQVAPATNKYMDRYIIRGIAAFFIITIAGMLGYALATTNWASSVLTIPYSGSLKFSFTDLFNSNVFNVVIVLNIIFGLLFIDTLLRRKRMHHRV